MAINPATRVRHQAGTSAGGRFAPQSRDEGDVALTAPAQRPLPGAERSVAEWFDVPAASGPAPVPLPTRSPDQVSDAVAGLIAARIRAGHALVLAHRAHGAAPDVEETRELLRRAEEAVRVASARLDELKSPRMEQS